MARVTCRCLNVAVHYKDGPGSWSGRAVDGGKVLPRGCGHRLCGTVLYEVDLEQAGVTAVSEGFT